MRGRCTLVLPPRKGMTATLRGDGRRSAIMFDREHGCFVLERVFAYRSLRTFEFWGLFPDLTLTVYEERSLGRAQCDTRCTEASGDDCSCQCWGQNHGIGVDGSWRQVGDTTLVRSEGRTWVVRTVTPADVRTARRRFG